MNSLKKLQSIVGEIVEESRHTLKKSHAFVVWFAEAYIVGDRKDAVDGLIDGAGDMGVDGVYVDDKLPRPRVALVQGKYHLNKGQDNAAVRKFAEFASAFMKPESRKTWEQANALARDRLVAAHDAVHRRGCDLALYFATTGTVSRKVIEEAQRRARAAGCAVFEVLDNRRILSFFEDWLGGIAPPLPELHIAVAGSDYIHLRGSGKSPDAWVFNTSGAALKKLYEQAGDRLFARNIRGHQGQDTRINRDIRKTAEKEPELFWYVNNGITIVADEAQYEEQGNTFLRMKNPQIVNGQQTTRELSKVDTNIQRVQVPVRVIVVPSGESTVDGFRGLVAEVVKGTNRQNPITPADLMANDPEQVRLERELRKRGYFYVRKRASGKEIAVQAGRALRRIQREDLANALATTVVGPQLVRKSEQWMESNYGDLFSSSRPMSDYLSRWWLAKRAEEVSGSADANKERPARWAIMSVLWKHGGIRDLLRSERTRQAFIKVCEQSKTYSSVLEPLHRAASRLFVIAGRVYKAENNKEKKKQKTEGRSFRQLSADALFRRTEAYDLLTEALRADRDSNAKFKSAMSLFVQRLAAVAD